MKSEKLYNFALENSKQSFACYLLGEFNKLFLSDRMKKWEFIISSQRAIYRLLGQLLDKEDVYQIKNQAAIEIIETLKSFFSVTNTGNILFSEDINYISGTRLLCNYLMESLDKSEAILLEMDNDKCPKELFENIKNCTTKSRIIILGTRNNFFQQIPVESDYKGYSHKIKESLFHLYRSLSVIERILDRNLFIAEDVPLHPLYSEIHAYHAYLAKLFEPFFTNLFDESQQQTVKCYRENVVNSNIFGQDDFEVGYYIIAELMKIKFHMTDLMFETSDALEEIDFYYHAPLREYHALSLCQKNFEYTKQLMDQIEDFQQKRWGVSHAK